MDKWNIKRNSGEVSQHELKGVETREMNGELRRVKMCTEMKVVEKT